MATETRTTDKKARVTLPRAFANSTVIVDQVSDTEVRIRKARVIPEEEVRFAEEMRTPLTPRDYDLLVDLIDNPPEPTEALRRAVAKYAKRDK
jgi:Protein of unknown function (DUF1778)